MAPRMRKDVWKLPANDKTLFWYGQAIKTLQAKPITDVTSWWSLAAMHGIDPQLWIDLGYLDPAVQLPFPADPTQPGFWNQCQHGSWYFLPWHRAYLGAFEAILLDTIVKLGGPSDWALPYWNYDPERRANLRFPQPFAPRLLDHGSHNPLWVKERYGRRGDGVITVTPQDVPLTQLWEAPEFFDEAGTIPTSFGGTQTAFHHDAGAGAGQLEQVPHGPIHNLVGGSIRGADPSVAANNGLMSMFETAAIDPVFWLHHANIDRLWESWLKAARSPGDPADAFQNPANTDWLDQPAGAFVMPAPNGSTFTTTARQVLNTLDPSLNYVYQELTVPVRPTGPVASRLRSLGMAPAEADRISETLGMPSSKTTELVGEYGGSVRVAGAAADARVQLDPVARDKLTASLSQRSTMRAAPGGSPKPPDRVYLALENITSATDAGVFHVYINLPDGADPKDYPKNYAGVVSLFGARAASQPGGPHAGNGLAQTLDITAIVDALHLGGALDHLDVKFIPQTPMSDQDKVDVGRVRVYRQSRGP